VPDRALAGYHRIAQCAGGSARSGAADAIQALGERYRANPRDTAAALQYGQACARTASASRLSQ
jgi:hypothetical protein